MPFEGALTVTLKKAWHRKLFIVKEPLVFTGREMRVEVPVGFETDLASIPWWARWVIPKAHSNAYAAVIHDFCYDTRFTERQLADAMFFEALRDPVCNTSLFSAWVMWAAVRVGGRRGWQRARQNDKHFRLVEMFGKRPDQINMTDEIHRPADMNKEGQIMPFFNKFSSFKKPARRVTAVYLHCSAHDGPEHDNPETMDRWHKARGWSGIGYHFYIDKSGQIFHGRPLEKIPAAQAGFNKGSIAICCGGLLQDKFTAAQFNSLRRLCGEIDAAYSGNMVFRGHCEVSPKTCPVFDYKAVLRLDKNGRIMDGVPTVKKLEASKSEHMKAAKKQQDGGDIAVATGGGVLVTGALELSKNPDTLDTLKNITSKGLEYKAILKTASELMAWLMTWEGLMMTGGAMLAFWGWRMWRNAKALKELRLKEEPNIQRLKREALAAFS